MVDQCFIKLVSMQVSYTVLKIFACYAHVKDWCLKSDCFIRVYSLVSKFHMVTKSISKVQHTTSSTVAVDLQSYF